MKHRTHIRPLALAVALLMAFASCEKVLDVDIDPAGSQLVVNAVPQAGKRPFVYFAHTRFFLDPSNDQPLDSVSLTLSVNGVPYAPDSLSRCKYFFPVVLAGGDTLTLDARSGSRTAHAATYVPFEPTFHHVTLGNADTGHAFRYYQASLRFQDHPGIAEYYSLRVMVRDSGLRFNEWTRQFDTVDTLRATYFLLRHNPEITGVASYTTPLAGLLYTRNFFNDQSIDGQDYNLQVDILHLVDTNEVQPFKHEFTISLESMTFARLRYVIDASRQGSGNSFFSEQGTVRGNVDGALGIFAGSAKSEVTFWPDTLPVASSSGGTSLPPPPQGLPRTAAVGF